MRKAILLLVVFFFTSAIFQGDTYEVLLNEIAESRGKYKEEYENASEEEKKVLLDEVRTYLEKALTEDIFPQWMGTPWDFNGYTSRPQKGEIACGFFITTTLKHLGFDIPRIKWGQLASETLILKLQPDIKRFLPMKTERV
ncbi:MAG: hypothetical protein AAF740_15065, partial [Bacteroidota bacterium]